MSPFAERESRLIYTCGTKENEVLHANTLTAMLGLSEAKVFSNQLSLGIYLCYLILT